jgi:hypothetical protein
MSIKGKNSKSIRKKGLSNTRNTVFGMKSIKFHHETNLGEVYIDISSLVTPTGFVNPSPSELLGARIKDFSENLMLMSSARPGPLMEGLAYEIVSNNSIKLKFETYQGEIFTGVFHNNAINGTLIADVRTPNASGELLEGQTDFNLGEAIPIKELSSQWPIQLFRGTTGRPMLRNSNNAQFSGDHSVGNYEMVDRGDGFCQVVRFNIEGDVGNEPVMWANHGALGERPNLSTLQQVDKIHGIMDTMREDLLLVTGNDITNPTKYDQGVPTNADLKAFGDLLAGILNTDISQVTEEVIVYDGFISKNASENIKLKTLRDDTGGILVTDDNSGDHTRYTFQEECNFCISGNSTGSGTSGYVRIQLFDANNVELRASLGAIGPSGVASSALNGKALLGHYVKLSAVTIAPNDNIQTNFSVVASKVIKNKIRNLI